MASRGEAKLGKQEWKAITQGSANQTASFMYQDMADHNDLMHDRHLQPPHTNNLSLLHDTHA